MKINIGNRNNTLSDYAKIKFMDGKSKEEVLELLRDYNKFLCNPPLPDKEVLSLVNHY